MDGVAFTHVPSGGASNPPKRTGGARKRVRKLNLFWVRASACASATSRSPMSSHVMDDALARARAPE
jgi:hypothetical protein